jgi:hypothetical protein
MTPVRRQRKAFQASLRAGLAALIVGVGLAWPGARAAVAATTERIITDRHTGLAIDGYDPVAYFTEGAATPGLPDFEHRFSGVVWRFRNEGDLAAFIQDPDIYMPAFGGYDPIAISRGVAVSGNPTVWLVAGDRLFLFYSLEDRAAFAADPEHALAEAEARWPEVSSKLVQR